MNSYSLGGVRSLNDNGFNPMRWNCNEGGPGKNCFNIKCRPKIEVFAHCFPGKISFSDVDAISEINGCAIALEWKSNTKKLQKGQYKTFQNLSITGILTVLHVVGNAEFMEVSHMGSFFRGSYYPLRPATLKDVENKIEEWVDLALKRKLYIPCEW